MALAILLHQKRHSLLSAFGLLFSVAFECGLDLTSLCYRQHLKIAEYGETQRARQPVHR